MTQNSFVEAGLSATFGNVKNRDTWLKNKITQAIIVGSVINRFVKWEKKYTNVTFNSL